MHFFHKSVFFCCIFFSYTQVYGQHFTTVKLNEGIEISEKDKRILFYQQRPKSLDGKYKRTGYVHPLYSLNENVLTEDFPEDHPYRQQWILRKETSMQNIPYPGRTPVTVQKNGLRLT